jgi:polysaccharide transporter, PST family
MVLPKLFNISKPFRATSSLFVEAESSLQNKSFLSRLLSHRLVHNILTLYGVHFVNYLLPLVTVPYLARVLGPAHWGLLAFAQAFSQYLNLIIEYGFNLSATREVSRFRENKTKLADLLSGVTGAKVILIASCLTISLLAKPWIPLFHEHSNLFWGALFWAFGQSFNPLWYYQGLERMKFAATLDISAKTLATVGIFFIVHDPNHAARVLFLQGGASLLSASFSLFFAYREVPFLIPNISSAWKALRLGWTMFLFRSSVSLYTVGNTFILGLFVPSQMVAYYAGGEKISKALVSLLTPIIQALYPRLSYLTQHDKAKAAQLTRVAFRIMTGIAAAMGAIAFIWAPFWTRILLGPGYEEATPILRILSLLPILIAMSNVLGIQWMLPLGLDMQFNRIILTAGLINILLAVLLAPFYAHLGMAWAVVIAETFVTTSIFLLLKKQKLDPFQVNLWTAA